MTAEDRIKTEDWGSADVKCPFWRGSNERNICCEGARRGETIRRRLPHKRGREREMLRFCCQNYTDCEFYKIAERKYDEHDKR